MSRFKTWYDRHKEDFNEKRRERYENDPSYQEKQKNNSAKYRRTANLETTLTDFKKVALSIEENGQTYTNFLVPISFLARNAKCSVDNIKQLERREIIPPTPFRGARDTRYYTPELHDFIIKLLRLQKRTNTDVTIRPIVYICVNLSVAVLEEITFYTKEGVLSKLMEANIDPEQTFLEYHFPESCYVDPVSKIDLYSEKMIDYLIKFCRIQQTASASRSNYQIFLDKIYKYWKTLVNYQLKTITEPNG